MNTSEGSAERPPVRSLGRYTLVERVGAGGMGEVWRALDSRLNRTVAIKMLLRGALGDETGRERFKREALTLSRLSHVAGPSFGLAHLEAAAGNIAEARRILEELKGARGTRVVSAWGIAAVHASLGDVDEAYKWLEIAVQEQASGLILLRVHPRLDPIRSDPRYWPLVRKVGLDDGDVSRESEARS